jgi:hypothetical protein
MRIIIGVIAMLWSFCGCNIEQPVRIIPGNNTADFQLLDTNGNRASVFHTGEEFDMSFRITNQTGAVQLYSYTPPRFYFWIRMGDSTVCTSADGYMFIQVLLIDTLHRGESWIEKWRAPNTLALPNRIVLQPGNYVASGSHSGICNGLSYSASMSFTVVP